MPCAESKMDGGMDDNHRKEKLSDAYVRAIAAVGGYTISFPEPDLDSVDITINKPYDKNPDVMYRRAKLDIQLKSTSVIHTDKNNNIVFDLSLKNYNDLRERTFAPRILVVLQLPKNIEEWLTQEYHQYLSIQNCGYYLSLKGMCDVPNSDTVRVKIPKENVFSINTLNELMNKIGMEGTI